MALAAWRNESNKDCKKESSSTLVGVLTSFILSRVSDNEVKNILKILCHMLTVLEDKDIAAKEKMKSAVESKFFHQIMSVKTSFREREMRKLTHQLCDFIDKSAANAVDDDSFLQSLLANSLRQAANAIESSIREERDEGQTMNEVWVDALKVGFNIAVGKHHKI